MATTVTYVVVGMTCDHCVEAVTGRARRHPRRHGASTSTSQAAPPRWSATRRSPFDAVRPRSTRPATRSEPRSRDRQVRQRRPRHRRHDLRVVRRPHREAPQQARRRHRHGQLRHRAGHASTSRPTHRRRPTSSPPSSRPATRPRCPRRRGTGHDARPRRRRTTQGDGHDARPTAASADAAPAPASSRPCSAVPVVAMSMIPALQFRNWQWLSLTLATPVVVWGAWPFHRAAWMQPAPRRRHDGHAHLARRRWPPSAGRCTRCSSATPACPA